MSSSEAIPELVLISCSLCPRAASKTCLGCKDTPVFETDNPKTIRPGYCSPACQLDDWPSHKQLCEKLQARKLIYRSGAILQDIFYTFEELTWELDVWNIEKKDNECFVHIRVNRSAYRPFISFKDFPHLLVPNDEDKKALLALYRCDESVAWMSELVEYFLKGL